MARHLPFDPVCGLSRPECAPPATGVTRIDPALGTAIDPERYLFARDRRRLMTTAQGSILAARQTALTLLPEDGQERTHEGSALVIHPSRDLHGPLSLWRFVVEAAKTGEEKRKGSRER